MKVLFLFSISGMVLSQTCSPGLDFKGCKFFDLRRLIKTDWQKLIKKISDTVPQGDIAIEYGNPLDIMCVLVNNTKNKLSPNASLFLSFVRNHETVPPEMVSFFKIAFI